MTKTIQEKQKQGTYRKSRESVPLTFQPLTEIPNPFFELSDVELKYFNLCCQVLISNNTLTIADTMGISRAARTYGIYLKALQDIEKFGSQQTTSTGYTTKSGAWVVAADCEKILTGFEKSQGLNLVSRSKLPPAPKAECWSEFDEILDENHKAGTLKHTNADNLFT